jgi:hypothetical protein
MATRRARGVVSGLTVWVLSAALGCGGGGDLLPSDATAIEVSEIGGLAGPPPAGSVCHISDEVYTLLLATRTLSWHECVADAGGPYRLQTGSGIIADSDYQAVLAAAHAVALSVGPHCGADAPVWSLTVTTPAGNSTYYDQFYKCQNTDKTYVSGVPELLAKLRSVRPPS